ncbi:metal-dependent hydrolase [Candidatus Woesearchaeota archaeon]|nr:metal-dependent hydrolase [Candidatus Woesearchaeota archaeon]MBI2661022.1 metal-dependent hydrolase [Candidatus Woesearchaeota archaeon]
MIFAHLLIGLVLGKLSGNYLIFILGSVFPDFDHVYVMVKNRFFSMSRIINSMRFEEKFGVRYKTPLFHSIPGLILFSVITYFFSSIGALYFAMAYLLHLLIDWPDIDEKYYLYPLKIRFRGVLPIWSKPEQIFTIILLVLLLVLYL